MTREEELIKIIKCNINNLNMSTFIERIPRQTLEDIISVNKKNIDWNFLKFNLVSEEIIDQFSDCIDWFSISCHQKISEQFIEKHIEFLKPYLYSISYSQILSEDFIEKHKDELNWAGISTKQKLSENFIRKYKDKLNWTEISKNQNLSEAFIEEHKEYVNWLEISTNQKLSNKFIEEHKTLLDLTRLIFHQKLSEEFIEQILDGKTFSSEKDEYLIDIIIHQKLSEKIVNKYRNEFKLYNRLPFYKRVLNRILNKKYNNEALQYLCSYQKFSEEFIEKEFLNKINALTIITHQKLSEEFIEKYLINKVDHKLLLKYQTMSEEFLEKNFSKSFITYDDYLVDDHFIELIQSQKISERFMDKYSDKCFKHFELLFKFQKISSKFILNHFDKILLDGNIRNSLLKYQILDDYTLEKLNLSPSEKEYYNKIHKEKTREEKISDITEYAQKHNLKFDGEYLYAFRNHDHLGRGVFSYNTYYESGKYYKDFHCDMREDFDNSFGLGIFPNGNTAIKVSVDDFGIRIQNDSYKCRVKGFTVL